MGYDGEIKIAHNVLVKIKTQFQPDVEHNFEPLSNKQTKTNWMKQKELFCSHCRLFAEQTKKK